MSADVPLALVHPRAALLLPAGARAAAAGAWEALHDPATPAESGPVLLERLLDAALAGAGPRPLQVLADLVLAVRDGDDVRVLVRGAAAAAWSAGSAGAADEPLTATAGEVWSAHRRRGPGRVVLGRPDDASPRGAHGPVLTSAAGVVLEVPGAVLDPTGPLAAVRSASPPAPPAPPALAVRLPDGSRHALDVPLVLGRAPLAGEESRAVAVPSPRQQISATHLELRPGPDGGAVATDLGSTNGTVLLGPPARSLEPGDPVVVTVGARLDLGEGVVVEVVDGAVP